MAYATEFTDLLQARRKDNDILWASRPMNPLLPHNLPPESKYSRKKIMDLVLANPRVRVAVNLVASTSGMDRNVILGQARAMVNEMASKAHLATVRWLGVIITKAVKRIFSSVYVNQDFIYQLKREMQISQVQYIYVPSHRSYLDFVLLSYILFSYDMALPNIASGMDFYRMYLIGELLRKTGAFYMRRSFSNDLLYKQVFRAYVSSIVTHDDRAIEFFIEGTRSRSQKSIVPKYGLLSIILESFLQGSVPDIQFVPMSISYERPLEELLFVYELLGVPKPKETTAGLFRSLSILQTPCAYGNVFFNIGHPISIHQFISVTDRKARVLSPYTKLAPAAIENLAYAIIESHKKNTVITGFNIIALLFNDRVQMCPMEPYTLDTLIGDYMWCKRFFQCTLNAITFPCKTSMETNEVKEEILESLKYHKELLAFDESNKLVLRERHKDTTLEECKKVKGHVLAKETMRIAVPSISIATYVNPTSAALTKPAMVSLTVNKNGTKVDEMFNRYKLLRTLLETEFALLPQTDTLTVKTEWDAVLAMLIKEKCLKLSDDVVVIGENNKLFHLLHNFLLPFVDAIYITCITLFEWNEDTLLTNHAILIELQKRVEQALYERVDYCQHPYCLSLDLYNSTLSNFEAHGIIVPSEEKRAYRADRIWLGQLIADIEKLPLQRPPGSYLDAVTPMQTHSKL